MGTVPTELEHSGAGAAMYALTGIGGLLILISLSTGAFLFFGLLVLLSFVFLGAAIALNVAEDRTLDSRAKGQAAAIAAQVPRCAKDRTALAVDPQRGRYFCPRCDTVV